MVACPKCKNECCRDDVDIGVGVIHGPWGCPSCGWSEYAEYDLSDEQSAMTSDGGAIDQWGGHHPPKSSMAKAMRLAESSDPDQPGDDPLQSDAD